LRARVGDRRGGLAQIRDVVERIVETEDVDPVCGGGRDEAADEVVVGRPRADEEAAAQREPERRLRAGLQGADALPRALDPAPDGAVEAASARDLEVREARPVQDLGDAKLVCGRQSTGE